MTSHIEQLRELIDAFSFPPDTCAKVEPGGGWFFPGGSGLHPPGNGTLPEGGVIVLGSDCGGTPKPSDAGAAGSQNFDRINELLVPSGIAIEDCFYTNASPARRLGANASSGPAAGSTDKQFIAQCRTLLQRTIGLMNPKIVIPMGTWPTQFLARMFDADLPSEWRQGTWIAARKFPVGYIRNGATAVVPVAHPSVGYAAYARREMGIDEAAQIQGAIVTVGFRSKTGQLSLRTAERGISA